MKTNRLTNKFNLLIICAIFLRIFFAGFFYHPDLKSQYFHGTFLKRGVVDIYHYLEQHRQSLPYSDTFNYPPLTYYFLGGYNLLATSIAGSDLTNWIWDWGPDAQQNPQIYFYLLLLKLPYFAADLTILWLLLKLVHGPSQSKNLVYLWLLNPVSLYAVYMIGQFDIVPVLFTVACLVAFGKEKYFQSAFWLGLGAAMKSYPLLLWPFLALSLPNMFLVIATGILTGIVFILPGMPFIESVSYRQSVFQSGLGKRIFATPWYGIFYLVSLIVNKFKAGPDLVFWFFTVTSGILFFINFHPQWVMWMLPFLTVLNVRYPKLIIPTVMFVGLYFIRVILIPDQYMLIGQFVPTIWFASGIPPVASVIPHLEFITLIVQSLLAICGLGLILQAYRYEKATH